VGPCPRAPPLPLPSRANSPCALLPLRPRRGDKGCCAHHTAAPKLLMGGTAQGTAAQRGRASSDDIPRDRGSAQELLRLNARAMGAIGWIFGDPASSESASGPVLTRVSSKYRKAFLVQMATINPYYPASHIGKGHKCVVFPGR
jgi:hypothetical protein